MRGIRFINSYQRGKNDMKNLSKLLLIVVVSFGIIGGCDGGGDSWEFGFGPVSSTPFITSWHKKPKCADDERRCHGICYPNAIDCPGDNPTDADIYIEYQTCNQINPNELELTVSGVAYGPVGTEISFEFENPVLYADIYCSHDWNTQEENCVNTETSNTPVTTWFVQTIQHSDYFTQEEDFTVYINELGITTTVECLDATGDILREDCFTYHQIATSECPAEEVFDVCTDYQCDSEVSVSFPSEFTNCEIIDCTTIDCDQANNIHVDGLLSWTEYIDGQESEAGCF